ncbi:MAG: PDGLE domain-containing protein [Candidatus Bathyarchaeia archaeon]
MCIIVLLSPWFGYAFEPLDVVVEHYGAEETRVYEGPMPDYTIPWMEGGPASGIMAGLVGIAIALFVGLAAGRILRRREGGE